MCNRVYPNVLELGNGSLVSYAKQLKLINTPNRLTATDNNHAIFRSYEFTGEGLFTNKYLRKIQLSQLAMKRNRKTLTGKEVFLGHNLEYSHDQLGQFGVKTFTIQVVLFPWFVEMGTQMIRYWKTAREAIFMLTVYLLCKV